MRPILVLALVLAAGSAHADYESDVMPIFKEKCFNCHGDGKTKGAVNLDPENMSRLFGKGKFIQPGDAESSLLYTVTVTDRDAVDFMPPPDKGDPLTASEARKVKAWINAGAAVAFMGTTDDPSMVAAADKPSEPEHETWTNSEGQEITAKLVRVDGDKAVLIMKNGKSYNYPVAKLSAESQARVKAFAEKG